MRRPVCLEPRCEGRGSLESGMIDHHIYDPAVETRPVAEQFALDREQYRRQVAYLFDHSEFYQQKFAEAGIHSPDQVGELDDIAALPFTEKDEIRQSQANFPPFGNTAASPEALRVFSTSGTTGLAIWDDHCRPRHCHECRQRLIAEGSSQSEACRGFCGPRSGAVYYGFDKIGANVIPVGTGIWSAW